MAVGVVASYHDLRARIIPDWLTVPLMVVGFSYSLFTHGLWVAVGTLLVGGALCELLARYDVFGGGDLKLLLGLACLGGPLYGLTVFYFSLLWALPLFGWYMLAKRTFRPSVPYAVAILAALIWMEVRYHVTG